MRKIKSASEIEISKTRNKRIIGVVLLLIMGFSVVGFAAVFTGNGGNNSGDKKNYNGIEFSQDEYGLWVFSVYGGEFKTQSYPTETEEINFEGELNINELSGRTLYFSSDNNLAISEVIYNIGRFASRYQEACITDDNCENDLPVKTCEDNFIIIKESNQTKAYKSKNCVFIEYKEGEEILASDKYIFKILGIQE